MKLRSKILWAIYVAFLLYAGYTSIWGYWGARPEKHYIPDGYIGRVDIYYNQPNGKEKEYLGDTIIYRIDKNGKLKTKFGTNNGIVRVEYYYVDSLGVPIRKLSNLSFRKKSEYDSLANLVGGSGVIAGTRGNDSIKGIQYMAYRIDTFKNMYFKKNLSEF